MLLEKHGCGLCYPLVSHHIWDSPEFWGSVWASPAYGLENCLLFRGRTSDCKGQLVNNDSQTNRRMETVFWSESDRVHNLWQCPAHDNWRERGKSWRSNPSDLVSQNKRDLDINCFSWATLPHHNLKTAPDHLRMDQVWAQPKLCAVPAYVQHNYRRQECILSRKHQASRAGECESVLRQPLESSSEGVDEKLGNRDEHSTTMYSTW